MEALLPFAPLALEGQWHGAAAVALVLTGIVIFIGTIYVLLVAVYGWLQAYLVTIVALMAFSIILSSMWAFGIPGTIPGTGPRGTEPSWVIFTGDSEQGQEFATYVKEFPAGGKADGGWRFPDANEQYPGGISPEGELDNIKRVLEPALAGYFQKQKTGSGDPAKYNFFTIVPGKKPATDEERALPQAHVFFKPNGEVVRINPSTKQITGVFETPHPPKQLLFGIDLPKVVDAKTGKVVHPAIRVFGYRNKGRVFQASAEWLVISILLFALHLFWLGRFEKKQKVRAGQLSSGALREPAAV